ncbi:MAG: YCF48-related protein [bacterium]|nr:YCF48-related protein [bacterium]
MQVAEKKVISSNGEYGTWEIQLIGTTGFLNGVDFIDENNGWAVGSLGTILYTTDGGSSWLYQSSEASTCLNDVDFVDTVTGWVVGREGTILYTEDGGLNWKAQESGTELSLINVCFVDKNNGWVIGGASDPCLSVGVILHTNNGGQNWQSQVSGTEESLESIVFTNRYNGWIVGSKMTGGSDYHRLTILHTVNSGAYWNMQEVDVGTIWTCLTDVDFVTASHGYAVGYSPFIILHYHEP